MALGALAGAMLLWSGSFIAMKLALAEFHPALAVFARMLGSVFLLAPFAPRVARSLAHAGRDRRLFAILVLCEPCLYFIFEAYALKYTSASQAGVVTSLSPLLVGVGAFFILKERLSAFAWTGVFLAVSGVIWLTLAGEETTAAPNALLGNTLEFCAMLMACVYTLCVRKLMRYPPFFIAAVQAFGGTLFFGIIFAGTGFPLPERIPSLQALASLAFLSVVTILAYGLYNIGVARLSAARAAAWLNLIPALTLIMGIVFLGESLSAVQGLAIAPILAGVLLSLFGKTRPPLDESI
jgi:drug/metabolite transporter (DMT)-like permease